MFFVVLVVFMCAVVKQKTKQDQDSDSLLVFSLRTLC